MSSMPNSPNIFNRPAPEDCIIVIFGGSGDLAKRKLFPALGNLKFKKHMPKNFQIVAVGRKPMESKELLSMSDYPSGFSEHFEYLQTDYTPEGIAKLKERLEVLGTEKKLPANHLFYLAIPPDGYADVAMALRDGGLIQSLDQKTWSRIVVEKPYGSDLATSVQLNKNLLSCFDESQIYRIDHYLGKEAVQNLMVFRFANSVFEPIWNKNYIDNIQISNSELLGNEDRAAYFDSSGLLRDMLQNHLMQILCLVTMEPPVTLTADAIRGEKVKVLQCLRPLDLQLEPPVAVRGQYGKGKINDKDVLGYREEKGVKQGSNTETFAAMRLNIDNFRWADVPIYIRSGKRLGRKGAEVVITFKQLPRILFNSAGHNVAQNRICFKIQPTEGIMLELTSKNPGQSFELSDTSMNFCYNDQFDTSAADAYERLLLDAVIGDPTLFVRSDETELSWAYLDPLIKHWEKTTMGKRFPNYDSGQNGPDAQNDILINGLRRWVDFSKYDNICT